MIDLEQSIKEILLRMPFVDYIFALVNAILTLQETGGTLTATGGADVIYIENSPLGIFKPRWCFIDLDNMQAGDTVEIRLYLRIKSGGGLQLLDYASYAGADGGLANGRKLIPIGLYDNRYGFEITLTEAGGGLRTYDWELTEEA